MATPTLRRLREGFPEARLSVLARPWISAVFEAAPEVDEVILYEKPGPHQGWRGKFRLARRLQNHGFEAALLFPHSFQSDWITILSRIPAGIGYAAEGRSPLLTEPLPITPADLHLHQVPFYFRLLRPFGIDETPDPWHNPLRLTIPPQGLERAEARLKALGITAQDWVVGLAPGAVFGSAKCWPLNRFELLAARLTRTGSAKVLFLGTLADTLAGGEGKGPSDQCFFNLLGKTDLAEALGLIRRCQLIIANDSGLMHAATALQVPTVVLFGPTDRRRTGPWGGVHRVLQHRFPCSPCRKKTCSAVPTCMEAITVEEVWETVLQFREQGGWTVDSEKGARLPADPLGAKA